LALYLWFYCSEDTSGISSASLGFNCRSDLRIIGFEPRGGVAVDSATVPCNFHLSFEGCPRGSFVVADILWLPDAPAFDLCFAPPPIGADETFACDTPTVAEPSAWIGYTTRAKPEPCNHNLEFFDQCVPTVAVTPNSWGRIKALYSY
jgi:hypothetical protein